MMFVLSLHMTGAMHKTGDADPDLDVPLILVVICVIQFFTIYLFFLFVSFVFMLYMVLILNCSIQLVFYGICYDFCELVFFRLAMQLMLVMLLA